MNISTRAKALIGAVAIGGAAVAMGGAFTAGGITQTAPTSQFIGGTANQSITGATLSKVEYVTNADVTTITSVKLTLDGLSTGKNVTATFTNNATTYAYSACVEPTAPDGTYTCTTTGELAPTSVGSLAIKVVDKANVTAS